MMEMLDWARVRLVAASVCLMVYGAIMLLCPQMSGTIYHKALVIVLLAAWIGAMIWPQAKGRKAKNLN